MAKKTCYCADSGIVTLLFSQKIAKRAKNGRKNKIILKKMSPLSTKRVILLRMKAQVQTYSVTEKLMKKSERLRYSSFYSHFSRRQRRRCRIKR